MKAFVLTRADVVEKVGGCELIGVYDMAATRAQSWVGKKPLWLPKPTPEALVYENGWLPENTRNLIDASPRAFVLMARAGLIPVTEVEAMKMLLREGKTFEPLRAPVANVQRVNADNSAFILRMKLMRAKPGVPVPPPPARIVTV